MKKNEIQAFELVITSLVNQARESDSLLDEVKAYRVALLAIERHCWSKRMRGFASLALLAGDKFLQPLQEN